MAFEIKDGKGRGNIAKVSSRQRLAVEASQNRRIYYVSRTDELAFTLNSHDATAAADTEIFYLKNDDTDRLLFVDLIRVGGVASILWKVWSVTGTAAGGNALTATNLNRTSGVSASITSRGDDSVTGLTLADQISSIRTVANGHGLIKYDDTLILGNGDAIAVEVDAAGSTDVAEVFCRFYFENPSKF